MNKSLFRSDDLSVVLVDGFDSETLVVTFDSYTFDFSLDRPGFGESFFQRRHMDAVHFVSRANDWYQSEDMAPALEAAAQLASRYRRVVTYGASMGGYAAVRFARRLGASTAIAIAPQYSIDLAIVPFETRWPESRRIRFNADDAKPVEGGPEFVVFYDPFETIDRQHVALLERDVSVTHVRVPYAGHSAGQYLAELAMMAESVVEIVEGRFDAPATERVLRRRRGEVGQYFDNLSKRSLRRPALSLALSRAAVERRSSNAVFISNLADRLALNGLFDEAEVVQRQALTLSPAAVPFMHKLVRLLLWRRAADEAIATLCQAIALGPHEPESHHLLAEARAQQGDLSGAIEAEAEAARLDPAHPVYRDALAAYREQAAPPCDPPTADQPDPAVAAPQAPAAPAAAEPVGRKRSLWPRFGLRRVLKALKPDPADDGSPGEPSRL